MSKSFPPFPNVVDGTPMALSNPKVKGKSCGALHVRSFTAVIQPTFLDYLRSGAEISFLVGVDYTGSNGDPRDSRSLHYLHPGGALTLYEQAISGVGRVLELYDSDKVGRVRRIHRCLRLWSSCTDHYAQTGPQQPQTVSHDFFEHLWLQDSLVPL